jgi:hypothetical protein
MAPPQVGSQFAGYRIESVVGRGGMGVVYRARQPDLDRTVALKLIAPDTLEDAAARERFVSEARHAAAIEHPNVVPIYAAGESDGVAYFVMRFVEGDDVRTRVKRDGPLAPRVAASIAVSVGAALDAIHSAGLVHRDVKPANILLADGDHVYLTDFGLARAARRAGSTTGSGRWAGSLHYAAPEQIRGGRVDARADVYALGGVLVFMLTGRVPFDRDSDEATLWAQVTDPPPRPSQLRRGLPKRLDDVVVTAMAKRPEDRYASAGDLGSAVLAAVAGGRAPRHRGAVAQGAASPSGARPVPGLRDDAPTLTSFDLSVSAPARRRGVRAAAVVAAGVVVAAVVAVLALSRGSGHPALHPATATSTPARPAATAATAAPTSSPTPAGARVAAVFRSVPRPTHIAHVGSELWVTGTNRPLTRMDALTGRHRARGPSGDAISARGNVVWIANQLQRELVAIAAAAPHRVITRVALAQIPVDVAADPQGGAWVGVDEPHYVGPGGVLHYDAGGRLLHQISVPAGVNSVVLAPKSIWVAEHSEPVLLRFDVRTGQTRRGAHLFQPASWMAYGGGSVWATLPESDSIARVRPGGASSYADAGRRPEHLTYSGGRVYVSSRVDQTLRVIDPRTMKPAQKPLSMPLNPYAVTSDRRHVWVTSLGADTVTRVDLG